MKAICILMMLAMFAIAVACTDTAYDVNDRGGCLAAAGHAFPSSYLEYWTDRSAAAIPPRSGR